MFSIKINFIVHIEGMQHAVVICFKTATAVQLWSKQASLSSHINTIPHPAVLTTVAKILDRPSIMLMFYYPDTFWGKYLYFGPSICIIPFVFCVLLPPLPIPITIRPCSYVNWVRVISFPVSIFPEEGLLGQMVTLCFVFRGTSILFP